MSASGDNSALPLGPAGKIVVRSGAENVACSGGSPTLANTGDITVSDTSSSGERNTKLAVSGSAAFAPTTRIIDATSNGGEDILALVGTEAVDRLGIGTGGVDSNFDEVVDIVFFGAVPDLFRSTRPTATTRCMRTGLRHGQRSARLDVRRSRRRRRRRLADRGEGRDSRDGGDGDLYGPQIARLRTRHRQEEAPAGRLSARQGEGTAPSWLEGGQAGKAARHGSPRRLEGGRPAPSPRPATESRGRALTVNRGTAAPAIGAAQPRPIADGAVGSGSACSASSSGTPATS